MNRRQGLLAVAGTSALALLLGACGGGGDTDSGSGGSTEGYPRTVENCDNEFTFDQRPERIVTMAQPQTSAIVALGAEDLIVGQAQQAPIDDLPGSTNPDHVGDDIPVIAEDGIPTREVTLSQEADLVLVPSTLEFSSAEGYATEEDLEGAGAVPYLAAGGCSSHRLDRSVEDPLVDIRAYGEILGEEDKAEEIATEYETGLADVEKALEGAEPVKVAEVFIWGDDIQSLAGSTENDLIKAAGGENIFASDDPNFDGQLFASLSAEVVAAEEPEAFVFAVGSEEAAEEAKKTLRDTFPTTPAVKNDRLIAYSSTASLPGSLTTLDAVEGVAAELHPDAF